MALSNLIAKLLEQLEPGDREQLIPYAGHIDADTVMLLDGSLMAMLWLRGVPFELDAPAQRNARRERINTLLRTLAGDDLTLSFHLVRHRFTPPAPQPIATSNFVRGLMESYGQVALQGLFRNDWLISAIVRPAGAAGLRKRFESGKPKPLIASDGQRRRLEDVVYLIRTTLSDYGPQRLGCMEVPTEMEGVTLPVTVVGSALRLILTGQHMLVPHAAGPLGSAIYHTPTVFGVNAFALDDGRRFGALLGLNNYPARPRVGMFNSLLATDYPLVMSHSFRFRSTSGAIAVLRLARQQMLNSQDAALDLIDGLQEAANQTASLRTATGLHHFTLAVYADTLADLDLIVANAASKLSNPGGAVPVRELNVWHNGALMSAYFSQLPGSAIFKPRPGDISTLDLASMASCEGFPEGKAEDYWGASILRFRTNGGTAYDFVTHHEDVGHALVIGRIGSGKTVLLGMVAAALEPVMGDDGIRLIIDKDEANRMWVEEAGGIFRLLRRNVASGLAPLVAYEDTPRDQSFLHSLYTGLMLRDDKGKLSSLDDARLARGISRQLKMPPEMRSMGGVREFLGFAEGGAGERFERWCEGGSMGWLLDNREHVITLGGGLYGFDFTDLIPREGAEDDGACSTAAAVIIHQLAGLMDGRRIAAFFDECRFYLKPLHRMIEDYTLTGRKKELMCWLVAQQPEHFTDSALGLSLVSQMRTKFVFPDASHNPANLGRLQISDAAIRMLKTEMTMGNGRRFLLWRDDEPVICEFDLTGMPQLAILSGRAGTVRLMERVRAETAPEDVIAEFNRRLENAKRRAA